MFNPTLMRISVYHIIFPVCVVLGLAACKQQPAAPAAAPVFMSDSSGKPVGPKVGYINTMEILALMPEVKAADSKLEAFARSKESSFQDLAQKYQAGVQKLQEEGILLSQKDQEARVQELTAMEGRLQQMQAGSQQEIGIEREKLYAPIMSRVDSMIKLVGKEQGFAMIYDASALLYADTTLNVTPIIKERLGIKEEEKKK
ncbi:MAG: OmpH family outer membrane protein [Bacteroidetes bacterium]|nr:MAG: OmpH family outer membrane protein [Bacteroidota bacterium]